MKIVIDIPDDDYEFVKEQVDTGYCNDVRQINKRLYQIIANGTVLPKGYGRLIDADSIYQIVRPIEQSDAEWGMTAETAIRLMHDVFNKAPTIIEADKEVENG